LAQLKFSIWWLLEVAAVQDVLLILVVAGVVLVVY
jgi:hypothetical protein